MWALGLPPVSTIAARPCSVTPMKLCGCDAARTASMAICTLPSVPFLNPTGTDSPEASSRCTWLSDVVAQIDAQFTPCVMYCYVDWSHNSSPDYYTHYQNSSDSQ